MIRRRARASPVAAVESRIDAAWQMCDDWAFVMGRGIRAGRRHFMARSVFIQAAIVLV